MRHLCTVIITILSLAHVTQGATVTPLSTAEQKRRVFSIVQDDYEDLRVDSNLDGKIEYWRIKKGPLVVDTYSGVSRTVFHIRKFEGSQVVEKVVVSSRGRLYLTLSRTRKQAIYNFTSHKGFCIGTHKTEWDKFTQNMKDLSKADLEKAAESSVAEECFEMAEGALSEALIGATKELLTPPSERLGQNEVLTCLESPGVKSLFSKVFGEEHGPAKYEAAVISMKNTIAQFPQARKKPIIYCKQTNDANPLPPMKSTEQGMIQVMAAKPPAKINKSDIKKQLFHEFLHGSPLENEDLVDAVTQACIDGKDTTLLSLSTTLPTNKTVPPMPSDVAAAAQETNLSASQAIPASVAETPQLSSPENSPVNMNRVANVSSTDSALSLSGAQTGGIVRMAEQILVSTPALAAGKIPSMAAPQVKVPTTAASDSVRNSSGLKNGEYIKEEVDLLKGAPSRSPASAQLEPRPDTTKQAPAATGAVAPASVAASTAGADLATGVPLQAATKNDRPQERTRNKSNAAPGSNSSFSREEVVSFIARGSYQQARAKLSDGEFLSALKSNNITVLDLSGKAFGALSGDIIFVDQGDRFVRRK